MMERNRTGYGLTLSVYRDADSPDCTNGGITGRHTRVTLVGTVDYRDSPTTRPYPSINYVPRECRVFPPREDAPPVWLVLGKHGKDDRLLIPGDAETGQPDMRHSMMGGNYAATSDSRFWQLVGGHHYGAVRVHDRYE